MAKPYSKDLREHDARRDDEQRNDVEQTARPARSDCLRHHHDGSARALLGADSAALAEIVIELESIAGSKLDHGIVGTDAVAVVAFEAVAAR